MKRNQVSVAVLAALVVCGVVQNASHAQGGVLLPETTTAPVIRAVPNVVEYPAKKVVRKEAAMPAPSATPIRATGRIVHVQNMTNTASVAPPAFNPGMVAPMSMGGFVTPRPVSVSAAPTMSSPTILPVK